MMEEVGSLHDLSSQSLHSQEDQMITKATLESSSYLSTLTNGIAGATDDDHRGLDDAVDEQSFLNFEGSGTDLANVFSQNLATQMAAAGAASYPYAIYPGVSATSTYDFGTAFSIPISNPIVSSTSSSTSGGANAIMSAPQVHHIATNNPQGSQVITYNGPTFIIHSPLEALSLNGTRPDSPDGDNIGTSQNLDSDDGQIVGQQQDLNELSSMQGNLQSYITRVPPMTIQWLLHNYETAEGVSLPRSTLYNHYKRHCEESRQDPVNAASFGKLIRSVFIGLRTRRIGTRGNSKYHYYGIRVKPNSVLNNIPDEENSQPDVRPVNKKRTMNNIQSKSNQETSNDQISSMQMRQYLGPVNQEIPRFPDLQIPDENGVTMSILDVTSLRQFEALYKEHCLELLDQAVALNFAGIEKLWMEFWSGESSVQPEGELLKDAADLRVTSTVWQSSLASQSVQEFIEEADYAFYQHLIDILLPDVLLSIPNTLTQAIRNFAKNLEGWMSSAIVTLTEDFKAIKIRTVRALAFTLRRYTGLNHLAQAARAVLHNASQISQMVSDLSRVDFNNIKEQASWVCQCDPMTVQKMETEFKATLQDQADLETWATWLQAVVDRELKEYDNQPKFMKAARQFLLRWSFYSSMVIRDLTLRSAPSFGSFHLIRLLYDEYIFYLIEHKVAKNLGKMPIAAMGNTITKRNEGHEESNSTETLSFECPTSQSINNNNNEIILLKQETADDGLDEPNDKKRLKLD